MFARSTQVGCLHRPRKNGNFRQSRRAAILNPTTAEKNPDSVWGKQSVWLSAAAFCTDVPVQNRAEARTHFNTANGGTNAREQKTQ